jgi:pSer/pThr/pTyr-binding forkhead associated (FHA) protein
MTNNDETVSGSLNTGSAEEPLPGGLYMTLEVIEGPDEGLKQEVSCTRIVIGRKDADVKLTDQTVSGRHAILEFVGGKFFLTDNQSTNGTKVNGEEIESSPLENMDELQVGDTKMLASILDDRYGAYVPEQSDEDTKDSRFMDGDQTMVLSPMQNPELPKNIHFILEFVEGADKGKKFQIKRKSSVIGRGEKCDIQCEEPTISKRHCQIEVHNKDKMTIKDLASANGTRLNDKYISAVKIRHGDMIQIGKTKIKILIHIRK